MGKYVLFYKVMRLNGIKVAFIFTCFCTDVLFMSGNWPGPPLRAHPNLASAYTSPSIPVDPPFPLQEEMTFPSKQREGE